MIKDVKRKKEEKKKVHFGLDKCLVVEMNVIRISQIDFYEILLYTKKIIVLKCRIAEAIGYLKFWGREIARHLPFGPDCK